MNPGIRKTTTQFARLLQERNIYAYILSEQLGIPKITLQSYLHGRRIPTLTNAVKIASYFQLPVQEVFPEALESET